MAQGKPAAAGAALGQPTNKEIKPCKGETELATNGFSHSGNTGTNESLE